MSPTPKELIASSWKEIKALYQNLAELWEIQHCERERRGQGWWSRDPHARDIGETVTVGIPADITFVPRQELEVRDQKVPHPL